MATLRLACQTITWDPDRAEKRDHTIREVAAAGYDGIEIGARFLDMGRADEVRDVLTESGIQLVALHVGWNPFVGSDDRDEFERVIAFAGVTGTPFVVMSGCGGRRRLVTDAAGVNDAGRQCRDCGIVLCYHNHWWEIEDDAAVLAEVARRTDPELVAFCPDIGWIRKTTRRVEETLQIIRPRIRMAHLKDYATDDLADRQDETELGEGILDFPSSLAFLRALEPNEVWVVAEQWRSSVNHLPPEQSVRANCRFLRGLLGDVPSA